MGYGTQYGKFKCKKCDEEIYFNEPDHWYSSALEVYKDEHRQMLEHIRSCYFEWVSDGGVDD